MALTFLDASLLLACSPKLPAGADVLMLGRQANALEASDLAVLQARHGRALDGLTSDASPWSEPFFHRLGAATVESLDYSAYEGAALIHDMNLPWPSGSPPRQYDLVHDGGTLEHVFHLPQALSNAMSLVKPGGLFAGVSPCDGWLGHGFHQPQPELFFRLFTRERGFKLHGVWLGEFRPDAAKARFFRLHDPATTGMRNLVPGKRPLAILVCAQKIEDLPAPLSWPGQSNYTAMWQPTTDGAAGGEGTRAGPTARQHLLALLPSSVRKRWQRWLIARKRERLGRQTWAEVPQIRLDDRP